MQRFRHENEMMATILVNNQRWKLLRNKCGSRLGAMEYHMCLQPTVKEKVREQVRTKEILVNKCSRVGVPRGSGHNNYQEVNIETPRRSMHDQLGSRSHRGEGLCAAGVF